MAWKNAPNKFSLEVLKEADDLSKRIAGEMLQGVIAQSPVDTGAFRGNHRVSVGSVDATANKSETSNPLQKGIATIQSGGGLGKIVYISNSLPYAERLENGWSQQKPLGVYATTFMNVVNKHR